MLAFDPDKIDVQTNAEVVPDEKSESGYSIKSNWSMSVPEQGGTAYFRLSPELRNFLKLCHDKHGVVGFEYDFEEGGFNFGIILKKEDEES